jgi:hypothetical protein
MAAHLVRRRELGEQFIIMRAQHGTGVVARDERSRQRPCGEAIPIHGLLLDGRHR